MVFLFFFWEYKEGDGRCGINCKIKCMWLNFVKGRICVFLFVFVFFFVFDVSSCSFFFFLCNERVYVYESRSLCVVFFICFRVMFFMCLGFCVKFGKGKSRRVGVRFWG